MRRVDSPELRAIAFFGGGTGGHLFPGVALAEAARRRYPGCRCVFFRTERDVEERVLAGAGVESRRLSLPAPRSARDWARYSLRSLRLVRELRGVLRGAFDAAVGLGGYASLPGILAARREGLPVVLLEQNQVPGKVNRWMSRFVDAVSCPDPMVARRVGGRAEVTGNPVRSRVVEASLRRLDAGGDGDTGVRTVLVVGGSQGARGLNRAVLGALEELREFREKIHWIHLAGDADKRVMEESYRQGGWTARVESFSHHLPDLMASSDLVVARAGGTTLAELTVLGVPAILVPYPHHKDRHQWMNARRLEAAGGAVTVSEDRLDGATLKSLFRELLFSPERLRKMATGCRSLGRPEAADRVLDLLIELRESCRRPSDCSS